MKMCKTILTFFALFFVLASVDAEEVTYRIKEYNKTAQNFVIQAWGRQPQGSVVTFFNDYGATTGNRYNQIPRNKQASFLLEGWEGCTVQRITFSLCSNNKAGTLGLLLNDGESTVYKQNASEFASEDWYGEWVSKDLGVYVAITKQFELQPIENECFEIILKGGTQEGSVYVDAVTIEYDPAGQETESPMGWVYEKLEAKSKLAEGDVVFLYRSGDAAADIDGIETSHYLDAIGVTNTSCVTEYDIERFTLSHDESGKHWLMTDQWGRQLGAQKAQQLAWDAGVLTWDIELGYSGATIASTNSNYGTLRYNAPSGSYPRFWNYTSKTLPLPYIYRRVKQLEPVVSTGMTLSCTERSIQIGEQDTLLVKATLLPTTTTDLRLEWESDNAEIATVRDGIIHPLSVGSCHITATAKDGGSSSSMLLTVTEKETDACLPVVLTTSDNAMTLDGRKAAKQGRGVLVRDGRKYLQR